MRIMNHRNFVLRPLNILLAPDVLKQTYLLDNYYISGGTLLGMHRDGDFIAGDSDIDIDVIGYDGIDKYIVQTLDHMDIIRTGYHKKYPMQLAFMYKKTIFDVWIFWRQDNFMVNCNDMGTMMVPVKFYDNPETIETKYGSYRAPGPIDEYLAFRYGPDWKTPNKYSKGIYTEGLSKKFMTECAQI